MTPQQRIIELAAQFCEEGKRAADIGAMLRAFQRAEKSGDCVMTVQEAQEAKNRARSEIADVLATAAPSSDGWVEDESHQTVDGVRYYRVRENDCSKCAAIRGDRLCGIFRSCISHHWRKVEAWA